MTKPNHVFRSYLWSCTSQLRYLCKVELGCGANDSCLTMGLIPNYWLDPWKRGGRLSGFESHTTKHNLSGFESHTSDDYWSGFESHGEPESTRKSNHTNMRESNLALDVGPVEKRCLVTSVIYWVKWTQVTCFHTMRISLRYLSLTLLCKCAQVSQVEELELLNRI